MRSTAQQGEQSILCCTIGAFGPAITRPIAPTFVLGAWPEVNLPEPSLCGQHVLPTGCGLRRGGVRISGAGPSVTAGKLHPGEPPKRTPAPGCLCMCRCVRTPNQQRQALWSTLKSCWMLPGLPPAEYAPSRGSYPSRRTRPAAPRRFLPHPACCACPLQTGSISDFTYTVRSWD